MIPLFTPTIEMLGFFSVTQQSLGVLKQGFININKTFFSWFKVGLFVIIFRSSAESIWVWNALNEHLLISHTYSCIERLREMCKMKIRRKPDCKRIVIRKYINPLEIDRPQCAHCRDIESEQILTAWNVDQRRRILCEESNVISEVVQLKAITLSG